MLLLNIGCLHLARGTSIDVSKNLSEACFCVVGIAVIARWKQHSILLCHSRYVKLIKLRHPTPKQAQILMAA